MARVKRPLIPANRPQNPPNTSSPNPDLNVEPQTTVPQNPSRRTTVRRTPARRTPVNPPLARRVTKPRVAKTSKKMASTSWFTLDDDSTPETEEATGAATPIPAIPVRAIRMKDLVDVTTSLPAVVPPIPAKVPSSGDPSGIKPSTSKTPLVGTSSKPINLVEGICETDSEEEENPQIPLADSREEDGCFLPNYFLPFSRLRMKIFERPRPRLYLPAPHIETPVEISDEYSGSMNYMDSEADCTRLDPLFYIPDLNDHFFEYSDDEYNRDLRDHLMGLSGDESRDDDVQILDERTVEEEEVRIGEPCEVVLTKKRSVRKSVAKKAVQTRAEPVRKRTRSQIGKEPSEKIPTPVPSDSDAAALLQHLSSSKRQKTSKSKHTTKPQTPQFGGFSSKAAEQMWVKIQYRMGLPDKGFTDQTIREFDFIKTVVEEQGIQELCKIPPSYNLTLVREFYAELAANKLAKSLRIRGVWISLKSKKLNDLFGLNPPKHTDFHRLYKHATIDELDEAAEVVGKPGAKWEDHPNYMMRVFRAYNLNPNANVWINFIRHAIFPTTHDSSICVERLLLLFCLMTGRSINLGKIMLRAIRLCSTRIRGKLYLPYTITRWMIKEGVPTNKADKMVKEDFEKWEIDMKAVSRMRDRKEKGGSNVDMMGMLQNVLTQNSNLIEGMVQQKKEYAEQMDGLKKDLADHLQKMEKMTEKVKEKEKSKRRKMKEKVAELEAEKERMAAELKQLRKAVDKASSSKQPTKK